MMGKNEGLKFNVSVTDTKLFSEMVLLLTDIFNDERIEQSIKEQYDSRIKEIVESSGYYLEKKEGVTDE